MGSKHADFCRRDERVNLVAVADIVREKAEALALRSGAKPYIDFINMLDRESLDAVFIATPDHLHLQPVVEAAKRRINILVEKPMATNLKDAEKMAVEVKRSGVKFMVNFFMRWLPQFIASKIMIENGFLGELLQAYVVHNDRIDVPLRMWGDKSWVSETTVADFLMSHDVDLIRWISGLEAERVYATSSTRLLRNTPDGYQAVIEFENEFTASVNCNWIASSRKPNLVDGLMFIYGSRGTIQLAWHSSGFNVLSEVGLEAFIEDSTLNELRNIQDLLMDAGIFSRIVVERERGELYGMKSDARGIWVPSQIDGRSPHQIRYLEGSPQSHFIQCLLRDEEPSCSLLDGLRQTEIIQAIKESAVKREAVRIRRIEVI